MRPKKCIESCPYKDPYSRALGENIIGQIKDDGTVEFSYIAPDLLVNANATLPDLWKRRMETCSGPIIPEEDTLNKNSLIRKIGKKIGRLISLKDTKTICAAIPYIDPTKLPDLEISTETYPAVKFE